MHAYRTNTCGELRKKDVGTRARLSGWVNRRRDHGGLIFIDLRDHYGITQCVVEPDSPAFAIVDKARSEWVLTLTGHIEARTEDTINPDMPTGEIELRIDEAFLFASVVSGPGIPGGCCVTKGCYKFGKFVKKKASFRHDPTEHSTPLRSDTDNDNKITVYHKA